MLIRQFNSNVSLIKINSQQTCHKKFQFFKKSGHYGTFFRDVAVDVTAEKMSFAHQQIIVQVYLQWLFCAVVCLMRAHFY